MLDMEEIAEAQKGSVRRRPVSPGRSHWAGSTQRPPGCQLGHVLGWGWGAGQVLEHPGAE